MAADTFKPGRVSRYKQRLPALLSALLMGLCFVLTSACMPLGRPPVADRSPVLEGGKKESYIVRRGDTLYSIAWRFDLDYRVLARANAISVPYLIHPGQKLRLAKQAPVPRVGGIQAPDLKNSTWVWPLPKPPMVEFGGSSKGMDFRLGKSNAAARAAAAGEVVYAGNGLGDYERLVIIKHSPVLLSAYSFDGKLGVRERQRLRAGSVIGDIQRRGPAQQALHFELRRSGKPIDPRTVLR